jgi:hypothetical protein
MLMAMESLVDEGPGAIWILEDAELDNLERLRRAAEAHGLQLIHDSRVEGTAGLDLTAVEWAAASFREFIESFNDSLSPDEVARYSASGIDGDWAAGGVRRLRARLLALVLLTLRGTPVVGGGPSDPDLVWLEGEERDPESDLNMVRHLVSLRRHCPALSAGDYHALQCEQEDVFAYVRETELQRLTVVLNFSSQSVDVGMSGSVGNFVAGTHQVYGDGLPTDGGYVGLEGFEGRVYELRRSW